MIKKILILLILVMLNLFTFDFSSASCVYGGSDVLGSLEGCVEDSKFVETGSDLKVDAGFKEKLIEWTTKIATYLGFGAIFAIAFGSLQMVLSAGEEEKIKKAKDIIKWGIIGFLGIVSAGSIISLVVKLVYSLGTA